jgi:putative phosphoribosyl transferase
VGALAEGGEPLLDERVLAFHGLTAERLAPVVEAERAELARRVRAYRGSRPPAHVPGRDVVLVDDGLATGVTARAALRAVRAGQPRRLVLAVPVAPPSSVRRLADEADDVVCVLQPEDFVAVGRWYDDFAQTADEEVLALLAGGGQTAQG